MFTSLQRISHGVGCRGTSRVTGSTHYVSKELLGVMSLRFVKLTDPGPEDLVSDTSFYLVVLTNWVTPGWRT